MQNRDIGGKVQRRESRSRRVYPPRACAETLGTVLDGLHRIKDVLEGMK